MPRCESCGSEIEAGNNFCLSCGGAVRNEKGRMSGRFTSHKAEAEEARPEARQDWDAASVEPPVQRPPTPPAAKPPARPRTTGPVLLPHPISGFRWHWGGFLMGWLWSFWHGLWWVGLLLIACWWIPWYGYLCTLGMSVWLGLDGWRSAWRNRNWNSVEQCIATQRRWMIWGIVLTVIPLLAVLFVVMVINYGESFASQLEALHRKLSELGS